MYVCMYCMFIYKLYTSVIVQHVLNIGVSKKTEDSHTKRCSMYMEYLLYLYHKLKANDKCTYIPYIMEHLGYRSTWTEMNRTLPSGMLNLQPHDVFFSSASCAWGLSFDTTRKIQKFGWNVWNPVIEMIYCKWHHLTWSYFCGYINNGCDNARQLE